MQPFFKINPFRSFFKLVFLVSFLLCEISLLFAQDEQGEQEVSAAQEEASDTDEQEDDTQQIEEVEIVEELEKSEAVEAVEDVEEVEEIDETEEIEESEDGEEANEAEETAQSSLSPGQKRFPPLSENIIKIFADNVLTAATVKLPEKRQIFPAESEISDFWLGNRPYLSTSIDKIELKFDVTVGKNTQIVPLRIGLVLDESEIIIRHSAPFFKTQVGGIRVLGTEHNKAKKFFFRAQNGTAAVILIPAYSKIEHNRGIVICPRDFSSAGSREEKSRLTPVAWTLTDINLIANADVRGSLRSSVDMVKARAEILSSPAVNPALNWQDQILSKNAGVSLYYKARAGFLPYQSGDEARAEGIEANIDLHAHTGFRRISRQASLLYVSPLDLPDFIVQIPLGQLQGTAIAAELKQRGIDLKEQLVINVDVVAGQCYLVLHDKGSIIHEYLKEPFQPPTMSSPTEGE